MTRLYFLAFLSTCFIWACKNNENQGTSGQTSQTYKLEKNLTIPDFWKNPAIFEYGREDARTDFIPFESDALANANQGVNSKYYKSLTGFWKYRYFPGPDYVPAEIEKASWMHVASETSFPGFMELKGFGKPIFKYHNLPFKYNFPEVPSDSNSIFFLSRVIHIDQAWKDRDVFAVFEGISCSYFVYLNGKMIGYNEDSKAASEFLLNPHLQEGPNDLTIVLFRWSDASYFESHNQWHLTGINRDAYLLARPKQRILDFYAKTDLKNRMGILDLDITLANRSETENADLNLTAEIRNDSNKVLFNSNKALQLAKKTNGNINIKTSIPQIKTWSDETPQLYELVLSLKNNKGEILEITHYPIGFRALTYNQNGIKWNDRSIEIRGAVCHEFHPTYGNMLDKPWIENDADVLKLQGINAVRNNHYPFPSYWYRFMQKFGLYVMDEANLNMSGFYRQNLNYPVDSILKGIALYRVKNMFERNKNYAHIIAWSLGYETGESEAIQNAYKYIKSKDPMRPAAVVTGSASFGDLSFSNSEHIGEQTQKAEIVYRLSTNQGNGLGGFDNSWEKVRSKQRVAGGFVEDFTDQTFYMKNASGNFFFAYGGDFGEHQSDSFRCVSGIMTSNKTPKPAVKSMSHAFSPFTIKLIDLEKGIIEIRNNQSFYKDTVFKYFWAIEENKIRLLEGALNNFQLLPGESKRVKLDLNGYKPKPGKYCVLNLTVNKASRVNGMFRFQDVATQQFAYPFQRKENVQTDPDKNLSLDQSSSVWKISTDDFSIGIDTAKLMISYIKFKNQDLLASPLVPFFSRAPVDNDIYDGKSREIQSWQNAWEGLKTNSIKIVSSDQKKIHVRMEGLLNSNGHLPVITDIMVLSGGDILLTIELISDSSSILPPRIGWICTILPKFGNVKWVGRGPYDGFQDRKAGLLIGEFKTTAVDFNVPLVRPQEMGIKTDLLWAAVSTFEGLTLAAYSDQAFETMVLPFAHSELFGKYRHGVDIPNASVNTLAFSSVQAPVGDGIRKINKNEGRNSKFRLRLRLTDDRSSTLWLHFAESW